ncbi:TPA: hypothetical protein NIA45_004588 [Pseudomonas aeruginosa]|nr:hypothetical protein [Pseudomonas aeruginosa]
MSTGLVEAFASSDTHLVDRPQHAAFCIMASESGFLPAEELTAFAERPSLKGLYDLTRKSVSGIGRAFRFGSKMLFKEKHRLHTTLSMKEASKETTAELAIGLIQGGVLDAAAIYSTVKKGDYTVPLLAKVVENTLEHESGLVSAEPSTCDTRIVIDGNEVKIGADSPTYYDFDLLKIPEEHERELSVLLQKLFAAITLHVIPIHTPSTFCGKHSYAGEQIIEVVNELEKFTKDFSMDNLVELIGRTEFEDLPFDPYAVGLELDQETGDYEEGALFRSCEVISQAYLMREKYSHWLRGNADEEDDFSPVPELAELANEARELGRSGKPTANAGQPIAEFFDYVIRVIENGHEFRYDNWDGNYEDGYGLFETFVIRMDENEVGSMYAEGYSFADCHMNEMGCTYIGLEIERELVARELVKTMGYIKEVHYRLRSLESVIEEIANAY